jgi:hypothetical protein
MIDVPGIIEGVTNTIVGAPDVEEVADRRLKICEVCPYFGISKIGGWQMCTKCGCSIKFKTHCLKCTCIDNRWGAEV